MNAPIFSLAEQLMAGQAVGRQISLPSDGKIGAGLMAMAGIFFAGGAGLSIYGSYLWLDAHYSPNAAIFLTGVICFVASLIVIGALYSLVLYRKAKLEHLRQEISDMALDALDIMEEEITVPVQNNPKTAVLIASVLGFVAGNRIL